MLLQGMEALTVLYTEVGLGWVFKLAQLPLLNKARGTALSHHLCPFGLMQQCQSRTGSAASDVRGGYCMGREARCLGAGRWIT